MHFFISYPKYNWYIKNQFDFHYSKTLQKDFFYKNNSLYKVLLLYTVHKNLSVTSSPDLRHNDYMLHIKHTHTQTSKKRRHYELERR